MLVSVVTEGIGAEARPAAGMAGGKTGTAQTGQYDENGEELLNYWFSGFYPAQAPRYTVTVLQDGILKPELSSAAIFEKITGRYCMSGMQPCKRRQNRIFGFHFAAGYCTFALKKIQ